MTRTPTPIADAPNEENPFEQREEAVAFESLTAEAEAVEYAQRTAERPGQFANDELSARPTCPFCGDANCTQHTDY